MKTKSFILSSCVPLFAAFSSSASAVAIAEPFAYPESLLSGQPVKDKATAPGMSFGALKVELEKTPIRELSKRLGAPLAREGKGDFTRDWTCLKNGRHAVWIIASDSAAVTEVQMAAQSEASGKPGKCYALPREFEAASIGGIVPGIKLSEALARLGSPTYSSDDGWYFWSQYKTIEEYSNTRIQINWTGIQASNGKAVRIFSSQVTNP